MLLITFFFLTFFFLVGTFTLTALNVAFRRLHREESSRQLKAIEPLFLYRAFHLFFFPTQEFEGVFFATFCAQSITRFCYALFAYLFLSHTTLFQEITEGSHLAIFWITMGFAGFIFLGFAVGDFLSRIFATHMAETAIRTCTPIASIFMTLASPLTFTFLKLARVLSNTLYFDSFQEPTTQAKQEIIKIIQKAELPTDINQHDTQLIESVLDFRERIVREVMVPRIRMFGLPCETSIRQAAQKLADEGYSRIPVYKTSIDNVIGILMYKDVLKKYMEFAGHPDSKILDDPIESICKPTIFTPETKKISNLLQEFRKKQVHLAIVVDEYGGTEGIVTIEDILEEIVGEIADEYDSEEQLFKESSDDSWIVDASVSIFDAEEHLGIVIPEEGDYDTIGGYIYHCTGSIPDKGFTIHHDTFEMEVLSSNERSVEKVRITPIRS